MAEVPGYCALCRSRCGTVNVVEGGRLVEVKANPEHPTGKQICPKGRAAPEIVHSNNRLLYPLKRSRPKGEDDPGWTRISWDHALAEIVDRFSALRNESGPESVGFSLATPSGTALVDSVEWIDRFIRLFGSPNVYAGVEVCNWHKDVAHAFTFGCGLPVADYANADLIVLWGHNPANTWLAEAGQIAVGRSRGAKLLVIDPRETTLARTADCWLRVRPGTDAALALALINLILTDKSYNSGFVSQWTNAPFLVRQDTGQFLLAADLLGAIPGGGQTLVVWNNALQSFQPCDTSSMYPDSNVFSLEGTYPARIGDSGDVVACRPAFSFLKEAASAYSAKRAESICWLEPGQLEHAARLITASPKVAYHAWTGIAQSCNATQTERAVAVLYALTGGLDEKGGNVVHARHATLPITSPDLLPMASRSRALGIDRFPVGPPRGGRVVAADLFRAIVEGQPYRIRALMGFGGNPLLAQVDTENMLHALRSLEYYVHCDLFHNPTSHLADLILPTNSPWEHDALKIGFEVTQSADELIMLRQKTSLPRGESKADYEIVFELAQRLGIRDDLFNAGIEGAWNMVLKPLGLNTDALRQRPEGISLPLPRSYRKFSTVGPDGVRGFNTFTRRVEIYSQPLRDNGYAPIPEHHEPPDGPDSDARFPYVLSSLKNRFYCQSQHRGIVQLRKMAPFPVLLIHPITAAECNVASGEWVEVTTRIGRARFIARVDSSLHPRVVMAEHGWWEPCETLGHKTLPIVGKGSSNFNSLISGDHCDPISGSVPQRAFCCNVSSLPFCPSAQDH